MSKSVIVLPLDMGRMSRPFLKDSLPLQYNTRVIVILLNRLSPLCERDAACQHHKGGTTVCCLECVVGMTTLPYLLPPAAVSPNTVRAPKLWVL
jgi:hypothetical protein